MQKRGFYIHKKNHSGENFFEPQVLQRHPISAASITLKKYCRKQIVSQKRKGHRQYKCTKYLLNIFP
jgi:hypothetical protein